MLVTNAFGSVTSSVATLKVSLVNSAFDHGSVEGGITALAPQQDGKIVVAHRDAFNGTSQLSRLNADGSLDPSWHQTVNGRIVASPEHPG